MQARRRGLDLGEVPRALPPRHEMLDGGQQRRPIVALGALGLYLFVILRTLDAARLAKDRLGSYLVLGVLASFTFQVVYNITMSAGLAPVKGLTLPLMSYGGSSMIATLAGFGLVLNVRMRRFTN